jgi:signal transduction histidine kinase
LPEGEVDIDPMLSTVFFRVLQESLTNVAKHSEATRVQMSLQCSDADMRLRVAADGRGFDPSASKGTKTFGLLGMHERAATVNGEFQVTSTPGAGNLDRNGGAAPALNPAAETRWCE